MSTNVKIYREVYGCSANFADYEIISGLLKQAGLKLVDEINQSDLDIIITCIVKTATSNRMIHRIQELTKLNKPLIVAGCMPKTEKKVIEKINPDASMLGPDSIEKIVDVAYSTLQGKKVIFLDDLRKPKLCLPRVRKNSVIDICEISTGCMANCSFCEVKFAKGKLFSYPTDKIVEEIKMGLKEGCKEIWISSQDCGCWGFDRGETLPKLLNKIYKIDGKFFVRVGMMNPMHVKNIVDNLIESYKSEKIFKFLHLPVQSGSNHVLKMMNRRYTIEDFKNIVKKFRKSFPSLTLSTDVIVGFPGESKEDFQKTVELMKETKPDIVNISKFGARPRTEASKMGKLPREIIDKRTKKINKVIEKIKIKNSKRWLNWGGEVLIDEIGKKGGMIGRNFAYKPVLTKGELGTFCKIKINEVYPTYLIGE